MSHRIHFKKLKNNAATPFIIVDLLMVMIVIANLSWIVFDFLFDYAWFVSSLNVISSPLTAFYQNSIHQNFYQYDLI